MGAFSEAEAQLTLAVSEPRVQGVRSQRVGFAVLGSLVLIERWVVMECDVCCAHALLN